MGGVQLVWGEVSLRSEPKLRCISKRHTGATNPPTEEKPPPKLLQSEGEHKSRLAASIAGTVRGKTQKAKGKPQMTPSPLRNNM